MDKAARVRLALLVWDLELDNRRIVCVRVAYSATLEFVYRLGGRGSEGRL